MTRKSNARKPKTARRAGTPGRPFPVRKPDTIAALVAASAQILALSIDPAWDAGVKLNLQVLFRHAALVDAFLLPDEVEPAPVFRA
jgi:hypothetical protein